MILEKSDIEDWTIHQKIEALGWLADSLALIDGEKTIECLNDKIKLINKFALHEKPEAKK